MLTHLWKRLAKRLWRRSQYGTRRLLDELDRRDAAYVELRHNIDTLSNLRADYRAVVDQRDAAQAELSNLRADVRALVEKWKEAL